jgi:pSer/pThr/pTyr-binding forkhead associated (FHA) protein
MAKLVLLSEGLAGKSHELKVEKTTIGRVDDNTFPISEPSVSSHHCEILLKGTDVVVKDLNSTNGTFINGEQISESVLKPGQVLRLGKVEMRLEDGATVAGAPPAPAAVITPSPAPAKKAVDQTLVIPRGVSLNELEQGSRGGFDTASKGFSKKENRVNKIFVAAGIGFAVVIVVLLFIVYQSIKKGQ